VHIGEHVFNAIEIRDSITKLIAQNDGTAVNAKIAIDG
jgi:hypothetical protein